MKKFLGRLKNQAGLTLVELLAVIVILGILAAIAVPSIMGIIQGTREDAVKADAITVLNMAKLHVSANANIYDPAKLTTADANAVKDGEFIVSGKELKAYLDGGEFVKLADAEFYVLYNPTTYVYSLTTTKQIQAGNNKILFTNAKLNDIEKEYTATNNEIVIKP